MAVTPTRMTSPRITVKVAAPDDFPAADQLLDSVYAPYAGPIDRSRQPRRIDPSTMRRFLAESDGRLVGTATINRSGGVLDWAIPGSADTDAIALALLTAGEAWVREHGGTEILLYTPPDSAPSESSMRRLGFRPVRPPYVVMQVVHFPGLLNPVAQKRAERFRSHAPFTMALHLERGLYPPLPEPDLLIEVTTDGAVVRAGTGPADVSVTATATAFSEFLFGARDLPAFLQSGVTLVPEGRKDTALRVLALFAFDRPWFVPLGERR
jgi:hypothetical protein